MEELSVVLSTNERYMPGAMVALEWIALNAKPETALDLLAAGAGG